MRKRRTDQRREKRELSLTPECRTLSGFARDAPIDGIALESLAPGTTLLVRTNNSRYRMTVLDGGRHRILVQGGALLPTATEADLQGSTAGGSLVRTGWIEVDRHLELAVGSRRITTSPVRSVSVEPAASGFPQAAIH
jgi:hypothetical protein